MSEVKSTDAAAAAFLARWLLGLLFTMAGWWKVFTLTATAHAKQYFVAGFADSCIPQWLLWPLGLGIPYLELIAGLLLLAGWQIRWTALVLGLLLLVTTYGHALQQPLFDIDGHTFTRMALILFLLMLPPAAHRWSIDGWLRNRG
ncbi:MAG: hypothetical protein Tsb002_10440 [Wenzhouxiangellaceae bacterium]